MHDATHSSAHDRYPIALAVAGRRVVVVGGGPVAQRKVYGLLSAGASVTVVAPDVTETLRAWAGLGRIAHVARAFADGDLEGAMLVFAATADGATNARVREIARAGGALVNDAGESELGDFSVPAVHRMGPVCVAVDTSAAAPSFARRVRDDIAQLVDDRYARAAQTLARVRTYALRAVARERRGTVMARLASADLDELAGMSDSAAQRAVDAAVPLVCATRGSALALAQARRITKVLAQHGLPSTLLEVSTLGDRATDRPIGALGADGVFVKEIETALHERRADFAVHSCKDLPSALADDMRLAAIAPRGDPRDAFCSERFTSFDALPAGAVVGTSSPRRVAQLSALRSDLRYEPIRGNVDTRLRKLRDGHFDAIVLAMAGLERLGARATHTVAFEPTDLLPAAGQGALAVECRRDDEALAASLHAALGDVVVERCVDAERAFLRALGAGCQTPVGALASSQGDRVTLDGLVAAVDGGRIVRGRWTGRVKTLEDAERLGEALATELLAAGAETLLRPSATAGVAP